MDNVESYLLRGLPSGMSLVTAANGNKFVRMHDEDGIIFRLKREGLPAMQFELDGETLTAGMRNPQAFVDLIASLADQYDNAD